MNLSGACYPANLIVIGIAMKHPLGLEAMICESRTEHVLWSFASFFVGG